MMTRHLTATLTAISVWRASTLQRGLSNQRRSEEKQPLTPASHFAISILSYSLLPFRIHYVAPPCANWDGCIAGERAHMTVFLVTLAGSSMHAGDGQGVESQVRSM